MKTLRDEFAMAALTGWISTYGDDYSVIAIAGSASVIAETMYEVADAFMKAREATHSAKEEEMEDHWHL